MLLVRMTLREAADFLSQLAQCVPHLVFLQTALSGTYINVADPGDHSGFQFGGFLLNLRKEDPVLKTDVGADQASGKSSASNQNFNRNQHRVR